LKKQTQFAGGQNGVIQAITMVYGDFNDCWQRKNKAKQSQFRCPVSSTNHRQDFVSTNQILFHGLGCRKGYTALYVKSEFYEFREVNHEKQ